MKSLEGKRLLVLGGSLWKNSIKKFADENKITVIATGNDPKAGIFEIADECYDIDSTDSEKMKKLIIDKHIDGVYMGGSEQVISVACQYINELGLPCYCTKEQWEYLQNKKKFKELCMKFELPVAKKYDIKEEELNEKIELDYPVVTKPVDGCASNGFSVCYNSKELKNGYNKAKQYSHSGNVIVEKYVPNDAIGVFYTFSNGKLRFCTIEDKYSVNYEKQGSFVGGLYTFESNCIKEFRYRFEKKLEKLFKYIGITEGSIWIEVFYNKGEYYFNEVGFRCGGSISIFPVDYFTRINQVAADIYYALTGESVIDGFKTLIDTNVLRKKKYGIYCVHLLPRYNYKDRRNKRNRKYGKCC